MLSSPQWPRCQSPSVNPAPWRFIVGGEAAAPNRNGVLSEQALLGKDVFMAGAQPGVLYAIAFSQQMHGGGRSQSGQTQARHGPGAQRR